MSSRLALDRNGRRIAVVTAPAVGLEVGLRFLVLGNASPCAEPGFMFTGTPTGRSPLPAETPRRNGAARPSGEPRTKWPAGARAEAHRLAEQGVSQATIAERVCGDRRFRSTVQLWLRDVARNGDETCARSVPKRPGTRSSSQAVQAPLMRHR